MSSSSWIDLVGGWFWQFFYQQLGVAMMNLEILCDEYLRWVKYHGDGRNGDDLRFGQHLHNKYGELEKDVFYFESATRVFAELVPHYV